MKKENPLAKKMCLPCEQKAKGLSAEEIVNFSKMISSEWQITLSKHLQRTLKFKSFKSAIDFINKIANIAELEGHHPDFKLSKYKYVTFELYTHKINALHENDFILAAKIDELWSNRSGN